MWDLAEIVLAGGLSVYAVGLTSGLIPTGHPHGAVGASVGVLAMTLPVLWARRAPLAAAICLGAAAPLNVLIFGSMVRCGPCLPAAFYVALCIGIPLRSKRSALAGLFLAGSLLTQAIFDPKLGPGTTIPFLIIAAGFYGIGRLVGQRLEDIATLRQRNAALVEHRDRSTALSIAIERERVATELEQTLSEMLDHIESVSIAERDLLLQNPTGGTSDARAAFADIERSGRQALSRMRAVLTGLRHDRLDDTL
jgi:signal transduction histidine kinase